MRGPSLAALLLFATLLASCKKRDEAATAPQPNVTSTNAAAILEERLLPVPPQTGAIAIAESKPISQTANVSANPQPAAVPVEKKVYPAQDIYDRASALIRKSEANDAGAEALKLFREAADAGNPAAQHALGLSYLNGIGVEKSPEEAVKWFRKSADQDFPDGLFKLASMYAHGTAVPEDRAKAAELAKRAADQGHVEAQYNLGTLYVSGRGVALDMDQAAHWFRKAAEGGHPTAQSNLGVLYAEGRSVEKNMSEAVKWWTMAADQGQRSAQFNLAQILQEGKEAPKDFVEAYKWYSLAADQGDREAAVLRNRLGTEMSPSEVAEALKRARKFKADLVAKWEDKMRADVLEK